VSLKAAPVDAKPVAGSAQKVFRIAVSDTGPGIPAEAIERIFAEFEQADTGPSRRHGGTGLGLAISRRLADAMGGDLAVTTVPGAGATFTLDLPLELTPQQAKLGDAWPRPKPGDKILLVSASAIGASPIAELLSAVGAEFVWVKPNDASNAVERGAAASALHRPPRRSRCHRHRCRSCSCRYAAWPNVPASSDDHRSSRAG
jgi:hypothetical protein